MNTRATNPSSGPQGFTLLDASKGNPSAIDMAIFAPKPSPVGGGAGARQGEGTVSSDYQQRNQQEDPWPPSSSCAPKAEGRQDQQTMTLSDCRIDTPQADLATDKPFTMSCKASSADGKPVTAGVKFRLFCTLPDGTVENTNLVVAGKPKDGRLGAVGTLFSPKKPVEWGTELKYQVVAEHGEAKGKEKSGEVEVAADEAPEPVAIWSLGETYFVPHTSFILPSARNRFDELQQLLNSYPDSILAIFGHCDSEPTAPENKEHSGRRAFAVYCLLTREIKGWQTLDKAHDGDDWDQDCTEIMQKHLEDELSIPKTGIQLYQSYMETIFPMPLKKTQFIGDPEDRNIQWACIGCGELNPYFQGPKIQKENFNGRITVALFPTKFKGSGSIRLPCSKWGDIPTKCGCEKAPDTTSKVGESVDRTWSQSHDTFRCQFYAKVGKREDPPKDLPPTKHLQPTVIIEIPGIIFNRNSAVPMPANRPIFDPSTKELAISRNEINPFEELYQSISESKTGKIVLTGFRSNEDTLPFALPIGDARAQAIASILTGDIHNFVQICAGYHTHEDIDNLSKENAYVNQFENACTEIEPNFKPDSSNSDHSINFTNKETIWRAIFNNYSKLAKQRINSTQGTDNYYSHLLPPQNITIESRDLTGMDTNNTAANASFHNVFAIIQST